MNRHTLLWYCLAMWLAAGLLAKFGYATPELRFAQTACGFYAGYATFNPRGITCEQVAP